MPKLNGNPHNSSKYFSEYAIVDITDLGRLCL